jgi:hypothetical protein
MRKFRPLNAGEKARIEKIVALAEAGDCVLVVCATSPSWKDDVGGQIVSNLPTAESVALLLHLSAEAMESDARRITHEELKRREES